MKKFLLTLVGIICSLGMWADTIVLDNSSKASTNSFNPATNWTLAMTGNTSKNFSYGQEISVDGSSHFSIKNSNGVQMTLTAPSAKVISSVTFYVYSNSTDTKAKLQEFAGTTCNDEVSSLQDASNPTVITKEVTTPANSITFNFGGKQVCFVAVVTYSDAASDFVADPQFTQIGNSVTMSCSTDGATIYYTLDGTEPTSTSSSYLEALTLENSASIRAKAFKGTYSSNEVVKDCYVSHSSALAVLGYSSGTLNDDQNIWTSNDGKYVLTDNSVDGSGNKRTIGYVNLAGSGDGFKINHTDSYSLVCNNIKVTKIVVVGKTWLSGDEDNASSISINGCTPTSGTFFDYVTDGKTYIKTLEFTPTTAFEPGATITITPSNNQLGAYIEIYGEEPKEATDPEEECGTSVIWDLTSGTVSDGDNTFTATDNSSTIYYNASGDKFKNSSLQSGGKSATSSDKLTNRYFRLQIKNSGKLAITSSTKYGEYLIYQGTTNDVLAAIKQNSITTTAAGTAVSGDIDIANGQYVFIGFAAQLYTSAISWTPNSGQVTLTTTKNMAGYRSFYDAEKSYTVDDNTTVYVVTAAEEKLTLTPITGGIYKGTPVILKTSAAAEADGTYKITLTEGEATQYTGDNLLAVSTAGANLGTVYRLGYKASNGVAFYQYTTTSATAGIVYYKPSNSSKEAFTFSFGNDTPTAVNTVEATSNTASVKKYVKNGQLVIKTANGTFNAAGARIK